MWGKIRAMGSWQTVRKTFRLTTEEIKNKMLLATDSERRTAWHWAVKGETRNITKILGWVKENLTTEEIKNNFLLASIYSFIKKPSGSGKYSGAN